MPLQAILLPGAVMPVDPAYDSLIEALGDDVDAIAKDLEVYAGAEPPPGYTLDHEIAGVLRAADDAGFDRFHLVGYSGGGASGLAFAAKHPERLQSLALLEPAWMGNDELTPDEQEVWREFASIATLAPAERMPAFMAMQVDEGVDLPAPPPGPPPPWMAKRPAGINALLGAFATTTIDLDALRAFAQPVYFALGARSSPSYFGRMAERAAAIFPNFTSRYLPSATISTLHTGSSPSAPRARCGRTGRGPPPRPSSKWLIPNPRDAPSGAFRRDAANGRIAATIRIRFRQARPRRPLAVRLS